MNTPVDPAPDEGQVRRAADVLAGASHPMVLAGPGVARDGATDALIRFAERLNLPVATTFLGKGVFPDKHPHALGTIGFMVKDYANFGLDHADVVVAVGYDLVEYSPSRWNPVGDKQIIHIHRTVAEVDEHYTLEVGVQGNIAETLDALGERASVHDIQGQLPPGRELVREELERGAVDDSFPMAPGRIVQRYPRRPGRRRHRALRHGRREDVDGTAVSNATAEHLPGLERVGDDGVLAPGGVRGQAGAPRATRACGDG